MRIADDKDYAKQGEDAFYDWDGLAESRATLDEVRATWACALQRSGLVGVQHLFANTSDPPACVVPVVAAWGREWLLPTLLFPFTLEDPAWSDPQTGLETRVQYLLVLAQEHLVEGKPPQVIVFFCRTVSPDVRAALT